MGTKKKTGSWEHKGWKWKSCGCCSLFLACTAVRCGSFHSPQCECSHSPTHLTTKTILDLPLQVLPSLPLDSESMSSPACPQFPSWHSTLRLTFPLPRSCYLPPCSSNSSFFLSHVGARTPPSGLCGSNCPSLSSLFLPEFQNPSVSNTFFLPAS